MHKSAISDELLSILVCPEDKSAVTLAPQSILDKVNAEIAAGKLKNRAGETINTKIEAALIRQDQKVIYPIVDGIPVMLVEEAIFIEN